MSTDESTLYREYINFKRRRSHARKSPIRYNGDINVDVQLSEGNTKEARLLTIKKIQDNWARYLAYQRKVHNELYKQHRYSAMRDPVALSTDDNTFDEPYTLWLNGNNNKWLKNYRKEDY